MKETNGTKTGGEDDNKQFQEKFASLPLDEKFAALFKMEVATIGEAINYVVKEPMKVFEKLGDVITEFSARVETEFKKARASAGSTSAAEPEKATEAKKPRPRKTPKSEGPSA